MDPEKRRRLPKWVDDREEEHPEAAECRRLTLEERRDRLVSVCRAAMSIMNARTDSDLAFAYKSPLPEESINLLARLRERFRTT